MAVVSSKSGLALQGARGKKRPLLLCFSSPGSREKLEELSLNFKDGERLPDVAYQPSLALQSFFVLY